jgi:ABC-2 type transport system ATP-binding protein
VTGTASEGAVLSISGLTKHYRVGHLRGRLKPALLGLSLDVHRGEVFGYLGPNGSGKTTTLKLLIGAVRPDEGTATILGSPLESRAWRFRVGYLPENPYLYDYLTAREYLEYVARLFGLPAEVRRERTRGLLARVELEHAADRALRTFSKGMLQRVGLAQALVNDPDLVLLDEPMSGLDPLGRRLVRDLILELRERGKTVFFSTHILPDAEALCDRVALLRDGRLLEVGPLESILHIDASHMEVLAAGLKEGDLGTLGKGVQRSQAVGDRWRLEVSTDALGAVVAAVEAAGGRVLSVNAVRESLEDYFFKEMGGGAARGTGWTGEE